jgi:bifunctional DNase/RNase
VKRTNLGKVVYLKLVEPSGRVLPVYIGDFESEALERQMHNRPTDRPMTHDLMKTTLERLGYKVVRVRVTALMGNTYLARVHYCKLKDSSVDEIDVDARPSDALNLAARFGAPVYVNKEVAIKMGQHFTAAEATPLESPNDVYQSVKDILRQFVDPTTMLKVQLQVCIAEERYGDAAQLRNKIDHLLATDRSLALVVAMESALIDRRYTEAATLRDEYVKLQESRKQGPETQDSSDWQQLQQTQIWPSFNS